MYAWTFWPENGDKIFYHVNLPQKLDLNDSVCFVSIKLPNKFFPVYLLTKLTSQATFKDPVSRDRQTPTIRDHWCVLSQGRKKTLQSWHRQSGC